MKYYKKLFGWENIRRIKHLEEFKKLVCKYFKHTQYPFMADGPIEEPIAKETRSKINLNEDEIHDILVTCGINPVIQYTPPPAVGGYIQNVDLILNIFNLYKFEISSAYVLDNIERAIGIYKRDTIASWFRIINPIFLLISFLQFIGSLPFVLIGYVGFDRKAAENSWFGKLFKLIVEIAVLVASLLTIFHLTGYLHSFLKLIKLKPNT